MLRLVTLSAFKSLKGKRVLVRVDFNVPVGRKGEIGREEDARIRASLPTIERLRKAGAKVILLSHLGRPKGRDKKLSLKAVAAHLETLLHAPVLFVADDLAGAEKAARRLAALENGGVAMLENLRFHPGEEKNDPSFAKTMASLGDLYVDDAFAVAHRAAASNVAITKRLPSAAGLLFEREVASLSRLLHKPKRPFIVLMGGAKIETKLPTLKNLLSVADAIMIGGGMANNFLKAGGHDVGRSLVSPGDVALAKRLLARHRRKLVLPQDVLTATRLDDKAEPRVRRPDAIGKNEYIVDIGTETMRDWAQRLKKAKTIVWNGPVGLFEVKKFSHGSVVLGIAIAKVSSGRTFGVVGGGETVQCLERTGMSQFVDHVSTGGGAMLEFLSGAMLPGVKPLLKKKKR